MRRPQGEAEGQAALAQREWPFASLEHERWLWEQGYQRVAGVDEAGRGALAGPLVAAAVSLPADPALEAKLLGIRDSKLLTPSQRQEWFDKLSALGVGVGIAVVPAWLVDGVGLTAAGQLAFSRAVAALPSPPDFVLADAFRLRDPPAPQLALIHGDARCAAIAAASVVAKVYRDQLMVEVHEHYPLYAFNRHKGYATAAHRAALGTLGPCPEHRRSYSPVRAEAP
jgi:ribonuclease HII